MKIAVVFHDDNIYSGASRSMLSIIESWKKWGIEVVALVPGTGGLVAAIKDVGIDVISIPEIKTRVNYSQSLPHRVVARFFSYFSMAYGELYCRKKLAPMLKDSGIDIVYSNTTSTMMGYSLKKILNLPHVWHIREFGRLDQNCEFSLGSKNLYQRLKDSDLLIGISNAVKNMYCPHVTSRLEVVYNDISPSYIDDFSRDWKAERINCLSCGSLIPGKGHDEAINVAIELHNEGMNINLYIAGDGGKYKQILNDLINKNNAASYIHLLGQVKDMKSLRRTCHIAIVASKMEAFGRVTIEGMLSRMMIVGANAGGTSELIENNKTGYLYSSGDYHGLANIIHCAYNDRIRMQYIAQEGFEFAKRFTKERCAQAILNYLQELMLGEK